MRDVSFTWRQRFRCCCSCCWTRLCPENCRCSGRWHVAIVTIDMGQWVASEAAALRNRCIRCRMNSCPMSDSIDAADDNRPNSRYSHRFVCPACPNSRWIVVAPTSLVRSRHRIWWRHRGTVCLPDSRSYWVREIEKTIDSDNLIRRLLHVPFESHSVRPATVLRCTDFGNSDAMDRPPDTIAAEMLNRISVCVVRTTCHCDDLEFPVHC